MIAIPAYLVAFAGLALAAPVMAADTTSSSEAAQSVAKPKAKVICKRETQVGSNLSTKVCKTPSEWRDDNNRSRRTFEEREKD